MAALIRKGIYEKPLTILLPVDEEIIIGRRFFKDLHSSSHISLKHAVLFCTSNCRWFIKDRSEHHGVFVNRKKIPQGGLCEIHEEDSIGFGVSTGTCDEEFEFSFHVNFLKKTRSRKDKCGLKVQRSDISIVQKNHGSNCGEITVIETSLNSQESDDDSLSDTVSNSGSCIYVSEPEDDNSQMVAETTSVSYTSNILTTIPSVGDKDQEILKHNVDEIQCHDTCENEVNGSGRATGKEAADTEFSHPQQYRKSPVTSESGESEPAVNFEVSEKKVPEETLSSEKNTEMMCNGDTNEKTHFSGVQELDCDAKQKLSEIENCKKSCVDASEKSAAVCHNVACNEPDVSSARKMPKKKNSPKTRKRCLFTRKKKPRNKKNSTIPPKMQKQLQEDTNFGEIVKKYPQIKRKCCVLLQRLNEDRITNGSCVIQESGYIGEESVEKREPNLQNEIPGSGKQRPECDSSYEISERDKPKEQFQNSEIDKIAEHCEKFKLGKTNNHDKKPRTSCPEGKSSKLLRNYCLLVKHMKNIDIKPLKRHKKKHDISGQANNELFANDNSTAAIKWSSTVTSISETSKQESSKETLKPALSGISNKLISKSSLGVTSKNAAFKSSSCATNKERSKCSNNVPGSIRSNSGPSKLKKFVIPKKKPASGVDKNNAATSGFHKLNEKLETTIQKMTITQSDVRSVFSTYTIPKRKKSISDDREEEKSYSTCGKVEAFQERSKPFKNAYGNPPSKKGDVIRRLSAEDSHGGVKRTNDDYSFSCLPNKRVVTTREALPWDVGSYQSPNNFVHPNPQHNVKFSEKNCETVAFQGNVHLENKHLSNKVEGFCQLSRPREELLSFVQINQVNIIAKNDPLLGCSSVTSPVIHSSNNIPFLTQFTDQMQSKVNILDPRMFRGERSNSLSTYDRIGPNGCPIQNDQLQDMDICEPDNSNCLIDYAKAYDSSKTIVNSIYVQPTDHNVVLSEGTRTVNSECNQIESIPSKESVQGTTTVTSEVHEKDAARTDYPLPLRIPSPPVFPELTTGVTLESVLQQILSWNVNWLQEQKKSTRPPPVTISAIKKLQLSYFTFDDYALSFLSLILLETWQLLFTSWSNSKTDDTLHFIITNSNENIGSIILDCQMVTTSIEVPNFPKEGKLLTFELISKLGKVSRVFGYILKHGVERKTSSDISEELQRFLPVAPNVTLLLVKFTLKIKKKEVNLFLNKLMQARVIYYLKPQLHVIRSLLELPKSPLIKNILMPKKSNCEVILTGERNFNIVEGYTTMQQALILGICKAVSSGRQSPRIITVHGPPGTGKTHIILGVLQQLLKTGITKIFVTASSDAAVNEIGMRLRSFCESQGGWNNTNFILVGNPDKFPKDLLPFTLREVWKSVGINYKQKIKRYEEYDADIKFEIAAFDQSIKDMKERSCPDSEIRKNELELHNKLKQQIAVRNDLKDAMTKFQEFTRNEKSVVKSQLLRNADIIISTLNNSRHILVDDSLIERDIFTCCIIDEATQSVEPEVLQPLIYGMDKVILFGDKFLPPVIHSKASLDYNYELSLPERIHSYFVENGENSPVVTLSEQFRMDPEICKFPFRYFYSSTCTSSSLIGRSSFPLTPYIVLNSAKLSEQYKEAGSPSLEQILVKLCKELLRVLKQKYTIGIILPSIEQLKTVSKVLPRHVDIKRIDINTVDCFQSQEKDVIILPCSTSSGENCAKGYLTHKHKLLIALTRAKRSLIIFGNFQTMGVDSNIELLLNDAKDRGLCHNLDSLNDFSQFMINTKIT